MAINREVVEALLDKLHEYLDRIERMNFTQEELEKNVDVQDMLTHRLHTAVETSIDIGNHMAAGLALPGREAAKDIFRLLADNNIIPQTTAEKMQGAVGFRNIVVHEYDEVNFEMVFRDYREDVEDMKMFARDVVNILEK